jgi:hypothetical protein
LFRPTLSTIGFLAAVVCFDVAAASARTGVPKPDESLQHLLEKVGGGVSLFWRQISGVTCIEDVRQLKLSAKRKVLAQQDSRFDYLALLSLRGDTLSFEESRVLQSNQVKPTTLPLLVTNGFSTLEMVFHPRYQANFEYERIGEENLDGVSTTKVHFRHVPGTPSTAVLRLRNRDFPLELEGDAWVDPGKGTVVKVTAGLAAPLEDLGLRSLRSDVRYSPVKFTSGTESAIYWLPAEATVEVETVKQQWRNVHRFSDYKRFSIEATSSVQK